jgi:hypothetical protein
MKIEVKWTHLLEFSSIPFFMSFLPAVKRGELKIIAEIEL